MLICRPKPEADALATLLTDAGAEVDLLPLQRPEPPADGGAALTAALDGLARYQWLALTSAKAVGPVSEVISGHGDRSSPSLRVGAVGPATARSLRNVGLDVDVVPERATGADLADAVVDYDRAAGRSPGRLLAPLAAGAGSDLERGLRGAGYQVDRVDAYRMVPLEPDPTAVARALAADVVVVTAPSVARRLAALGVGRSGSAPRVVAIGPRSAQSAAEFGLGPVIEAAGTEARALADAILAAFHDGAARR